MTGILLSSEETVWSCQETVESFLS